MVFREGPVYRLSVHCCELVPSRFWIQEFWMMFRLHSSLSDSLEQFQELIRDLGQDHLAPLLETKWM